MIVIIRRCYVIVCPFDVLAKLLDLERGHAPEDLRGGLSGETYLET